MLANTYLQNSRALVDVIDETICTVPNLASEAGQESLRLIVHLLQDTTELVRAIEFSPPTIDSVDGDLVVECLEAIYENQHLSVRDLPQSRRRQVEESELLTTAAGYVVAPLEQRGQQAFTWLPTLDLVEKALAEVEADLERLAARARADRGVIPLAGMWAATLDGAAILSMDVSIIKDSKWSVYENEIDRD